MFTLPSNDMVTVGRQGACLRIAPIGDETEHGTGEGRLGAASHAWTIPSTGLLGVA